MKKPNIVELITLLIILALGAAVLYLYNNEPAPVTHLKEMNFSEDLIYSTFPREDQNQTIIKINESYILNSTSDHGILTIIIRDN